MFVSCLWSMERRFNCLLRFRVLAVYRLLSVVSTHGHTLASVCGCVERAKDDYYTMTPCLPPSTPLNPPVANMYKDTHSLVALPKEKRLTVS